MIVHRDVASTPPMLFVLSNHRVPPTDSIVCPVVYVRLPEVSVDAAVIEYSSAGPTPQAGIKLHSPVADTTITVDSDGFILDYPGLAERI